MEGTKLKFYVLKNSSKQEKKVEATEMGDYAVFEIELLALRADSSYALRQQHYTTAIESLTTALDNSLFSQESINANSAESFAKKHGLENFTARFELNWD